MVLMRTIRKIARARGETYKNVNGKLVKPKTVGPDCMCKKMCFETVPKVIREQVHNEFYKLASYELQSIYLYSLLKISEPKNPRTNRRKRIVKYSIRYHDFNEVVCQKAFISIFGITRSRVSQLFCSIERDDFEDRRGKHRRKITPEEEAVITNFVLNQLNLSKKSFMRNRGGKEVISCKKLALAYFSTTGKKITRWAMRIICDKIPEIETKSSAAESGENSPYTKVERCDDEDVNSDMLSLDLDFDENLVKKEYASDTDEDVDDDTSAKTSQLPPVINNCTLPSTHNNIVNDKSNQTKGQKRKRQAEIETRENADDNNVERKQNEVVSNSLDMSKVKQTKNKNLVTAESALSSKTHVKDSSTNELVKSVKDKNADLNNFKDTNTSSVSNCNKGRSEVTKKSQKSNEHRQRKKQKRIGEALTSQIPHNPVDEIHSKKKKRKDVKILDTTENVSENESSLGRSLESVKKLQNTDSNSEHCMDVETRRQKKKRKKKGTPSLETEANCQNIINVLVSKLKTKLVEEENSNPIAEDTFLQSNKPHKKKKHKKKKHRREDSQRIGANKDIKEDCLDTLGGSEKIRKDHEKLLVAEDCIAICDTIKKGKRDRKKKKKDNYLLGIETESAVKGTEADSVDELTILQEDKKPHKQKRKKKFLAAADCVENEEIFDSYEKDRKKKKNYHIADAEKITSNDTEQIIDKKDEKKKQTNFIGEDVATTGIEFDEKEFLENKKVRKKKKMNQNSSAEKITSSGTEVEYKEVLDTLVEKKKKKRTNFIYEDTADTGIALDNKEISGTLDKKETSRKKRKKHENCIVEVTVDSADECEKKRKKKKNHKDLAAEKNTNIDTEADFIKILNTHGGKKETKNKHQTFIRNEIANKDENNSIETIEHFKERNKDGKKKKKLKNYATNNGTEVEHIEILHTYEGEKKAKNKHQTFIRDEIENKVVEEDSTEVIENVKEHKKDGKKKKKLKNFAVEKMTNDGTEFGCVQLFDPLGETHKKKHKKFVAEEITNKGSNVDSAEIINNLEERNNDRKKKNKHKHFNKLEIVDSLVPGPKIKKKKVHFII